MTKQTPAAEFLTEFERSKDSLLEEYIRFLRFESVSAEPAYQGEVRACADWVRTFLSDSGLDTELWETEGHPVVFASWMKAGPSAPTVLIYNHYDVQPVDPVELWKSPPFEPRIENGEVFARGAQDNKGQCFYVMAAVRQLLRARGSLPVNLKLCIEGEEETGSGGLSKLLSEKREQLKADHLFIVDLGFHSAAAPALTLGVRGISTMTVELTGAAGDMHSGMVGGIVYNVNRAMAELLATLHDSDGRVTIPGFYDDVAHVTDGELSALSFHFDPEGFRTMFGAEPNGGEKGFSPLQRAWIRPTLEINGMAGGYFGDGFKTVIPARCIAKISCRLVPNQNPDKIGELVVAFLKKHAPKEMKLDVHIHPGVGNAVRSSSSGKAVQITAEAISEVCGTKCEFILSGGSIPVVAGLAEVSGAEAVLMGYGLPDDNLHAPNEHFGIERIKKGFATIAAVLDRLK